MIKFSILILIVAAFTGNCSNKPNYTISKNSGKSADKNLFTYLALGDSYTIGEAVPGESTFPFQLIQKLRESGLKINDPEIIAQTGWTTDELIEAINKKNDTSSYDLVTLLIGVNNQYRGYPMEVYRKEFAELLKRSITYAGGKKGNVLVLSVPDWGVTPYGKEKGNITDVSREIDAFNLISKEETSKLGVTYIDITTGSRNAASDTTLIASDGLHPSGKMYANWVDHLMPIIEISHK